jgi:hypothetical protein
MQVSTVPPPTKALKSPQINQGWVTTNAPSSKEANSKEEAWD